MPNHIIKVTAQQYADIMSAGAECSDKFTSPIDEERYQPMLTQILGEQEYQEALKFLSQHPRGLGVILLEIDKETSQQKAPKEIP